MAARPGVASTEEDAEILAPRTEFERLETILQPLEKTYEPQRLLYGKKLHEIGLDAADTWAKQSGFWGLNDQVSDVDIRAGELVERMIAFRPKTLAGLIATARSLKAQAIDHLWAEPEGDRDWDVMLLTRFFDGLIEIDHTRGGAS